MRRKAIGFLILALVVVAGIVFVERRLRDPGDADAWTEVDASVYRVVLGGAPPPEAAVDPEPSGGEPSRAPRRSGTPPTAPPPEDLGARKASAPVRPPNEFRYVVRSGDVLGAVVMRHLGTASPRAVDRVARDSGLTDPDRVTAGRELVIRVDVWEKLEANGSESLHDLAARAYGAPGRTAALRLANPHLPPRDDEVPAAGTPVWVAR